MRFSLPMKRCNVFCFVERVWATCSKGQTTLMVKKTATTNLTTLMAKTTTDIRTVSFLNSLLILFQMCQLD